jgi:hypothetical protein
MPHVISGYASLPSLLVLKYVSLLCEIGLREPVLGLDWVFYKIYTTEYPYSEQFTSSELYKVTPKLQVTRQER